MLLIKPTKPLVVIVMGAVQEIRIPLSCFQLPYLFPTKAPTTSEPTKAPIVQLPSRLRVVRKVVLPVFKEEGVVIVRLAVVAMVLNSAAVTREINADPTAGVE